VGPSGRNNRSGNGADQQSHAKGAAGHAFSLVMDADPVYPHTDTYRWAWIDTFGTHDQYAQRRRFGEKRPFKKYRKAAETLTLVAVAAELPHARSRCDWRDCEDNRAGIRARCTDLMKKWRILSSFHGAWILGGTP
jgi:hypothetical protein